MLWCWRLFYDRFIDIVFVFCSYKLWLVCNEVFCNSILELININIILLSLDTLISLNFFFFIFTLSNALVNNLYHIFAFLLLSWSSQWLVSSLSLRASWRSSISIIIFCAQSFKIDNIYSINLELIIWLFLPQSLFLFLCVYWALLFRVFTDLFLLVIIISFSIWRFVLYSLSNILSLNCKWILFF